jgi:hypothetical protein
MRLDSKGLFRYDARSLTTEGSVMIRIVLAAVLMAGIYATVAVEARDQLESAAKVITLSGQNFDSLAERMRAGAARR